MIKILSAAALLLSFAQTALAMPCDAGYMCKSASGRYQIELRRCRYTNDVSLTEAKISGKSIDAAALGAAWDGLPVGNPVLAFQVNVPTPDESVRILSVQVSKGKGTIKEMTVAYEPAPFKTVHAEAISCTTED